MKNQFVRPVNVDYKKYDEVIEHQKEALQWIASGHADHQEVSEYIKGIIQTAKPCARANDMLFWGFREPETMESDERVDYFYIPTYYTVAFMIQAFLQMADEMLLIDGFPDTFKKGLNGSTGRAFKGHGIDDESGLCDTMDILLEGNAYQFIQDYPSMCDKFTKQLTAAIVFITEMASNKEKYESHKYGFARNDFDRFCSIKQKLGA